jgi:NitT/TauT family transport system substrate-binding protein
VKNTEFTSQNANADQVGTENPKDRGWKIKGRDYEHNEHEYDSDGGRMANHPDRRWKRREFLSTAALAGTGALLGLRSGLAAAEPPPETTKLRLVHAPTICFAPQYMANELLRSEGFTDVQYVKAPPSGAGKALASGEADLSMWFVASAITRIDAGDPIVFLAGIHIGCFELFGTNRVRSIRDLKGKTVAIPAKGGPQQVFLAAMVAYVGLDPGKDINWVIHPFDETMQLLAQGKVDAFLGFPPQPHQVRAKKIGHVVVNSMMDRPWAQYFCCTFNGNREFVRKNPVATKRATRALLNATDICAREPARSARFLVDKGFADSYDHTLQTLKDIPFGKWREPDPEDTIRFYALRLHEVGMIKNSPQKIIAQGTDWRFLRELKKEMKA